MADSLRDSLRERYGDAGDTIEAAMLGAATGPFAPGAKRHAEHVAWALRAGVPALTKKPPARKRGRGR